MSRGGGRRYALADGGEAHGSGTLRDRRGRGLREPRRPLGARRRGARLGRRVPRRHRRQRRPSGHRSGPRRVDELAAVDHQRLPADARVADPARRVPRRPPRSSPGVRARGCPVHRGIAPLRGGSDRRVAGRRQAAAGSRRGPADARQPGDDRVELPPHGSCPGDRCLVRAWRRRHGDRAAPRRLPGRGCVVARDLPHQRPTRDPGRGDGHPPRSRDPRPDGERSTRLPWRSLGRVRPRRHHLRPDRGAGQRWLRDRPRGGHRRDRGADRLSASRASKPEPHDAARDLQLATVQRREPGHLRRLRGTRWRLLPAGRLPPDLDGLLADRRRRRVASGDRIDARCFPPARARSPSGSGRGSRSASARW